MQNDISIKTRNTLTQVECIIRKVPERYRKDLCESVTNMMKEENTLDYHFQAPDFCIIDPFHEICGLYNRLCEAEQESFFANFPEVAKQFEVY